MCGAVLVEGSVVEVLRGVQRVQRVVQEARVDTLVEQGLLAVVEVMEEHMVWSRIL